MRLFYLSTHNINKGTWYALSYLACFWLVFVFMACSSEKNADEAHHSAATTDSTAIAENDSIQSFRGLDPLAQDSLLQLQANQNQAKAAAEKWRKEQGLAATDPAVANYVEGHFRQAGGYTNVQAVAQHIHHVVQLVGVEYAGLGSDFDGVGDTLPEGLKSVANYPNLLYELLKMGYSEADIEKICSGNVLRVWQEVEKVAACS